MHVSDRITVSGMVFSGTHGVFDYEKRMPQPFEVDVELELPLAPAARNDDLNLTVDYGQTYETVREVVTGTRFNLVESLAETIAARLLERFPAVQGVVVRVRKPHVPLPGLASVQVQIARSR